MENPIKAFRSAKNMTQEQFGRLVGVEKAAVSKWEAGIKPSPEAAKRIEETTGGEISRAAMRPDLWGSDTPRLAS